MFSKFWKIYGKTQGLSLSQKVFSCEFYKISEKSIFTEHLQEISSKFFVVRSLPYLSCDSFALMVADIAAEFAP